MGKEKSILQASATPSSRKVISNLPATSPGVKRFGVKMLAAAVVLEVSSLLSGCYEDDGCDFYTFDDCSCPGADDVEYPVSGNFTSTDETVEACMQDLNKTEFLLPNDPDCDKLKDVPVVCKAPGIKDVKTTCKKIREEAGNNAGDVPSLQEVFASDVSFCTIEQPE